MVKLIYALFVSIIHSYPYLVFIVIHQMTLILQIIYNQIPVSIFLDKYP